MAKKQKKSVSKGKKVIQKKKAKKNVQKVIVNVSCTYNNTIISIADMNGEVLVSSSAGVIGFKGTKKSTAYAATKSAEYAVEKASKYGVKEAIVKVKGLGMGRQAALKGLHSAGLKIKTLMDVTPVPHGGVTPRKKPRGS